MYPLPNLVGFQDVMTPLCALLRTYASCDWEVAKSKEKREKEPSQKGKKGGKADKKKAPPLEDPEAIDSVTEIFVEAVGLMWNLCEANPTALEICNREVMAEVLLKNLGRKRTEGEKEAAALPSHARLCLVQCLYTVTEGNPAAKDAVRRNSGIFEAILSAKEPSEGDSASDRAVQTYLRVLALGVLINVEGFPERTWATAVKAIAETLALDHRQLTNKYTSAMPLADAAPNGHQNGGDMEVEGEEGEDHERLRVELNNVIQAQQTALEILANACCGDEDGEQEWVEEDEEEMGQVRRSIFGTAC